MVDETTLLDRYANHDLRRPIFWLGVARWVAAARYEVDHAIQVGAAAPERPRRTYCNHK
jgi:hypothetical protein